MHASRTTGTKCTAVSALHIHQTTLSPFSSTKQLSFWIMVAIGTVLFLLGGLGGFKAEGTTPEDLCMIPAPIPKNKFTKIVVTANF